MQETVGIDFLVKNIHYQGAVYRLQLWDTAGQEKFKSLVPNYIRDAHCAVFVYDITRRESFDGVDSWLELYRNYRAEDAVTILVGNKSDLREERKVTREEGMQKARAKGLSFCETSAKSGSGIEELFHSIIENIKIGKEHPREEEKEGSKTISTSEVSINKTKIVKIGQEKKQLPCCYI
jgi:Ras-related protein Rab-6A